MSSENTSKADLIDLAFKVMAMLIIPIGVYIFNMGTDVKLLEQKVEVQKSIIEEQKSSISDLKTTVANGWNKIQLNTLELRQLREQISAQSAMLREVYEFVLRQQGGTQAPPIPRFNPSTIAPSASFQPLPFGTPTSRNPSVPKGTRTP